MSVFTKLLRDEAGASAAEYALIIAIIGVAMGVAAIQLGREITQSIDGAGDQIQTVQDAQNTQ